MGKVVSSQAGYLEVGDLIQVPAILSPEGHGVGEIKIHAAPVNEGSFGLVVAGIVADAHTQRSY